MNLNNLDLNKLKCFQAVAEKGTLLEGAKYLGLTPSAVYQSSLYNLLYLVQGSNYINNTLIKRFLQDFKAEIS